MVQSCNFACFINYGVFNFSFFIIYVSSLSIFLLTIQYTAYRHVHLDILHRNKPQFYKLNETIVGSIPTLIFKTTFKQTTNQPTIRNEKFTKESINLMLFVFLMYPWRFSMKNGKQVIKIESTGKLNCKIMSEQAVNSLQFLFEVFLR